MRVAMALLAAVTVALGLVPAAHAEDYTKKTLHFPVVVGPNDDKRCDVIGDLYTPAGATAAHPDPAILTTNGFGGSKNDQAGMAKAYASRGYVVLSYSGLGFGGSGCQITLDDRDYDGKAASQLVSYLGNLDYVVKDGPDDPRVGMIGGSYGGEIQFATAGIDPRVDTIVPFITWNNLAYSLLPNNTGFDHGVTSATPGVVKDIWALLFTADGILDGLQGAQTDPGRLLPCPNFATNVCPSLLSAITGAPTDAEISFLTHASVASFMSQIKVPTLLLQGEADTLFNLQEAVATYQALRAQGTPVKMVWQSWGHSHGTPAPGELSYDISKPTYEGTVVYEWFQHYLKGVPAAPSLDFTFFRDWVKYSGDATPAYGRAPSYPIGRAHDFDLSGNGTLQPAGAAISSAPRTFLATAAGLPTSYTELSAIDPGSSPVDLPGTYVAYESGPLAQDTDVIGVPSLDVHLSAPLQSITGQAGGAGELALFFRLEDVAPNGSVTLPHKLVAPVRIANLDDAVHVELPGIVHRFAAGHKLRLVVYSGDYSYRGNFVPAPVTVQSSPAHPSVLHLPVATDSDYGPVVRAAAAPAASCTVPKVVGRTLAAARRALRRAGCGAARTRFAHSRKVGRGRVVASSPKAGTHRRAGARVRLTVSRGR